MKFALFTSILIAFVLGGVAPRAAAQSGSIEFVAHATPSGGLEEPIRGFPFSLLSKSFEDIAKEAEATSPKPDQDAFIDKLDVSKELKAWMKKNHSVTLSGEEFASKLRSADIMEIPEFFSAYMARNSGDQFINFPKPKYKPTDKVNDPAKYEKLHKEYLDAIRHYIDVNPQSIEGIDVGLADIDPGAKWDAVLSKRVPDIHRQTLLLAQSKYLVAHTQTDLQGQGFFRGIPPGSYWLSTLDVSAEVGDARPRWDVPVRVLPNQTAYIALSDANAVQPSRGAP